MPAKPNQALLTSMILNSTIYKTLPIVETRDITSTANIMNAMNLASRHKSRLRQ